MRARLNDNVDLFARRNGIVRTDLPDGSYRVANEIKARHRGALLARFGMDQRPRCHSKELTAIGVDWEGKPLPESLGDEGHDRVKKPQRVVERVGEDSARDFTIVPRDPDAALRRFQIPIREIVPDEATGGFRVLAQAKSAVPFLRAPLSFFRTRWSKRRVCFERRRIEAAEYPAIGEGELVVAQLVDAPNRSASDIAEEESSNVPELSSEVASRRERAVQVLVVEHEVGTHTHAGDHRVAKCVSAEFGDDIQRIDAVSQ